MTGINTLTGEPAFHPPGDQVQPQTPDLTPEALAAAQAETLDNQAAVNARLPIIVPESQRVASSPYVVGTPDGGRWQDLTTEELTARGEGFDITQEDFDRIHAEVMELISAAAQSAVETTGAAFALTPEEVNKAMQLPLRGQLWYELSAEVFKENLPGLSFGAPALAIGTPHISY